MDAQLIIVVADKAALAIGLLPGIVVARRFLGIEREMTVELVGVGQQETEA